MEIPYFAFVIIVVLLFIVFVNWENSKSEKKASEREFNKKRDLDIDLKFTKERNKELFDKNEELKKQIKDLKK
ncbi:MAG: hypothetical protein PHT07_08690 [Paludibacter sp.]|nr:hypothetical protein [Paludibacter sp.]